MKDKEFLEHRKERDCNVCPYYYGKPKQCITENCVWDEDAVVKVTKEKKLIAEMGEEDYRADDCYECPYHGIDDKCIGFCMKKIVKEHKDKWAFRN